MIVARFLSALAAALAWLGRQGTRALAAMVFVGIAVPPLGALLKPFVSEAIYILLFLAFLRVEPAALRTHVERPALVIAVAIWSMVVLPALLCLAYWSLGIGVRAPDLMLALVLQAASSPLMSAPAIAALLGLDAAIVLLAMVLSTMAVPLTAPIFVRLFLGDAVSIAPLTLGVKLLVILGGAAIAAIIVRRLAGAQRVRDYNDHIDGLNVIIMFVFVAALMTDVGTRAMSDPLLVLGLVLLTFILTAIPFVLTILTFSRAGWRPALSIGLMASQRNMGLMLAAVGGTVPDLSWLYFALAQFPIYLLPQMMKPVVQRTIAVQTK